LSKILLSLVYIKLEKSFSDFSLSIFSGVSESPSYFQQRISMAIQRRNAVSVLGTVAKTSGLEEVFYLFKI
jgi:hypothetical protein